MSIDPFYDLEDLYGGECGCCGYYHRPEYRGDCRNDLERFDFNDLQRQADRRAEVDAWLDEIGAVQVRVEDLGVALGARSATGLAIEALGAARRCTFPPNAKTAHDLGQITGQRAAHLARLALGEP